MAVSSKPPLIAARSFEAAARHRSFLKAAEELHVTPTAISHQVKRLEEYLGQALFVRLNRAVELTGAGTALAGQLHELFAQLDAALDPQAYRARTTIHISAMPSLAARWLAPRLPEFEARHPEWQIRLAAEDELVDFTSRARSTWRCATAPASIRGCMRLPGCAPTCSRYAVRRC
jgi:LysR family glycine cleavage system transcriptional activator